MLAHAEKPSRVRLPAVIRKGTAVIEEAIAKRRSIRHFRRVPLSLDTISRILWAAQGITDPDSGFRAVPSAGALFPLELYLVVRMDGVEDLPEGVYHYDPKGNILTLIRGGDSTTELESATWNQGIVKEASATLVIMGVLSRTAAKYGSRSARYVYQESGHAAQNVFLEATSMGLGTVAMGAFREASVRRVVGARADERPLYVQPLGVPA